MCIRSRFDSIQGFTVASSTWLMPSQGHRIRWASRLLAKVERPDVVYCCDRNRASLFGPTLADAWCRAEPSDLYAATRIARRSAHVRICRNEGVRWRSRNVN